MIRGTKRPLEEVRSTVKADFRASIHNRFDIEVVDAKTGEIKNKAVAHNVICDQLWTKLISSSSSYFNYIHYGNGTGTPSASDTQLFGFIGYGSAALEDKNMDLENGVFYAQKKMQLSESTAVGQTITEIGIAHSTSANSLCTHAMLADMNGNTVSITKTDTDIINVYATVFVHWNQNATGDGTLKVYKEPGYNTVMADPNGLGIANRAYGLLEWAAGSGNFALPLYYMKNPTGMQRVYYEDQFTPPFRGPTRTYDVANKRVTATYPRFTVSEDNVDGGIRNVMFPTRAYTSNSTQPDGFISWRLENGSAPVKSTIVNEAIGTGDGVTTNFKTKFGFAHDAVVYIDGVPVSGVTVDSRSSARSEFASDSFVYLPEHSTCAIGDNLLAYSSDNWGAIWAGEYSTFFNPYWEEGLLSYSYGYNGFNSYLKCSDDLVNWDTITDSGKPTPIPAEYQHRKYWRIGKDGEFGSNPQDLATSYQKFTTPADVLHNVRFDTPPAAGAVITADYVSDTIAKDENHVFDLTITIQLGEYTEN